MILDFRDAPRIAIAALIAAAVLLGFGAFEPRAATAAAELDIQGFCEPDSVRSNEAVMVSCTTTLTNTGDEALTGLSGSVFIAEGCNIPSRFTFVDRMLDGVLMAPLGLSFDVPDIGPGETLTQISRVATDNFTTGLTGGSVTITSTDKPDVSATVNLCWDVQDDAEAPSDKLTVTRVSSSNNLGPIFTDPDFGNLRADTASFQISIENVGDTIMTDVSILEVATGSAGFVGSDPPPNRFDSLERPLWDFDELAPGDKVTVLATYGTDDEGTCVLADGVTVVEATPLAGTEQDYVAFGDFGFDLGSCDFRPPDFPEDVIILPVDGGGDNRPTAPPEPRDLIDPDRDLDSDVDVDVDIDREYYSPTVATLPKAGAATGTSTYAYVWTALGLALAGTATSVASLRLRKRRTERRRL